VVKNCDSTAGQRPAVGYVTVTLLTFVNRRTANESQSNRSRNHRKYGRRRHATELIQLAPLGA